MSLGSLVKKLIKPLVLTSGILVATSLFNPKEAISQVENDTIWATGNVLVRENGTNLPIENANVKFESVYIPGDTVPDTLEYNFLTNAGGWVIGAEVPNMIDIGVGTPEFITSPQVGLAFPNPSSRVTVAFYGKTNDYVNVVNSLGQLVKQVRADYNPSKGVSGALVNLEDQAAGNYIFYAKTDKGLVTGKITNMKGAYASNQGSNVTDENIQNLKNLQNWIAIYNVLVTAEGYDPVSAQEEIGETFNLVYNMTQGAGIPQHQDIGGIVVNESHNAMAGVTARIREQGTNELLGEVTTNNNGEYEVSNIPAGKDIYFQVGGISGKFSYDGDEHEVPDVITNPADTAKLNFHFVLYDKVRTVPNSGGQTVEPTALQIDEMYLGVQSELGIGRNLLFDLTNNNWNETEKQAIRNLMNTGMNLFGLNGRYVETSNQLNQNGISGYNVYNNPLIGEIGVHIIPGNYDTDRHELIIETNLGNNINASPAADVETSLSANSFYKEFFLRVFFGSEVTSRDSFGNPIPKDPNNLDRAIINLMITHYENMLQHEKAYFGLNNIVDELPSKAPESIITNDKIIYKHINHDPVKVAVEIYDNNNKLVDYDNQRFFPREENIEFDISKIPSGNYCVDISVDGKIVQSKSFEK